jgi:hypothetical protein
MLEQAHDAHRLQTMKSNKQGFYFRSEMLNLVDGDTDAAVLLSCCQQRQQMENGNQGSDSDYFWKWGDLAGVIGLSRTSLDSSRHVLRRSGILIERKYGWPAKLEIHIDLDLLEKQLIVSTPELTEGEGIPVNRELLNFTGKNIHAALMLSYSMRRQREVSATLPPEKYGIYWPMRQQEWLRVFGLKRCRQESARKVLRKTGCWKERQWGWPAQNEFHLDLDQLLTILPAAKMLSDVKRGPA